MRVYDETLLCFLVKLYRWISLTICEKASGPGHENGDYFLSPRPAPQGFFFPSGDPVSAQKWFIHCGPLTASGKLLVLDGYSPFQLTPFHKIHCITAFLGKQLLWFTLIVYDHVYVGNIFCIILNGICTTKRNLLQVWYLGLNKSENPEIDNGILSLFWREQKFNINIQRYFCM